MASQLDLAAYLFKRLAQLGVGSIHGVPGDYNLTMLDYVELAGIHWVGNANELNAGYAADGYARIKGLSALITSFGVGELSAINAVAAAYTEKAPVVHIVGTPPRAAQATGACLHHSLGDGDFRVFADMYKRVTVGQANLNDPSTAAQLIDKTLKECISQSRPVYIEIPTDMVKVKVASPKLPIDLSIPGYNEELENQTAELVVKRIIDAKKALILVDGFTARFGARGEVNELVQTTKFPTLTTPFGKGIVNETFPNYHGIYSGLAGESVHQDWVSGCDLVLYFGPLGSDINTFGFTAQPNRQATIIFEHYSVEIGNSNESLGTKGSISIKSLLRKMLKQLNKYSIPITEPYPYNSLHPCVLLETLPEPKGGSAINQYSFWLRMSKFLRPGDIILTETGTSAYGGQSLILPENTTIINSSIWLSIGHMLAACQGAALAQREMITHKARHHGRTILFEGEGSLQMSAQAISDIIRNRLDVTIFILNNNGYTIERIIHGFNATYNDVQPWRHLEAASYFGAPIEDDSYPVRTLRASTWDELEVVIRNPEIQVGKGLNMIEIMLDVDDAPESLRKFVEYLRRRNVGESS